MGTNCYVWLTKHGIVYPCLDDYDNHRQHGVDTRPHAHRARGGGAEGFGGSFAAMLDCSALLFSALPH